MNQNNVNEDNKPFTIFDQIRSIAGSIIDWIWAERDPERTTVTNFVQALLRIVLIVFREIRRDRITLRAGALTYTIVLSLVPTLALGTAVLKGLGAGDQMRQAAYRFIDQIEQPVQPQSSPNDSDLTPSPTLTDQKNDQIDSSPQGVEDTEPEGLTSHLRKAVDQIFDYVDRTDFATLGAFGIVGLVLAVLSVLGSIEKAMNTIWQSARGRPFGRKIMDYLALMILMPITVNLALATETTLQSPALLNRIPGGQSLTWAGHLLLNMLPVLAVVATFTILYRFIPNTKVRFFPAIVGGFLGGIGWLLVQMLYIKLQIGVARYNAIYGSFATLPLLLLWVHIGWVIFLAGAEMAFAVQVWKNYNWKEAAITPVVRLAIAFDILNHSMNDFHDRKVTEITVLSQKLKKAPLIITSIVDQLVSGGMLRKVNDDASGYVPAAPEDVIEPGEIIDLIFGSDFSGSEGGGLANQAVAAARQVINEKKSHPAGLTDDDTTDSAKSKNTAYNN